jgi:hypothetical protein
MESRNLEEGAQRINDRNARKKQGETPSGGHEAEAAEEAEPQENLLVIRDPDLGNHIDLSG